MSWLEKWDRSRTGRTSLGFFFMIVAGLKLFSFISPSPPPDIGGFRLGTSAILSLILIEGLVGFALLTPYWTMATVVSLLLFLGIGGIAMAEIFGWIQTTHCGCLGPIDVNAKSRFIMAVGGLLTSAGILLPVRRPHPSQ